MSIKKIIFVFFFMTSNAFAVDISVMILYPQNYKSTGSPDTYIAGAISYANRAFATSSMDVQLKLKHHQVLDLPNNGEVSSGLVNSLVSNNQVNQLRDVYRPDLVVYLTLASSKLCGYALFPQGEMRPNSPDRFVATSEGMALYGVSAVAHNCGEDTFAHEIGHNLGAGHGPVSRSYDALGGLISGTETDHPGIPIRSSRGHGVRDVFRTIMAYSDVFGSAPVLAFHSNPQVNYNGLPTGTADRNNASGIYKIASQYVQTYSTCYPLVKATNRYGVEISGCGSKERYCQTWGAPQTVYVNGRPQVVRACTSYNFN